MADIGHLCLGCMGDKGSDSTCPHCGFQVGTPAEAPQHLSPGKILHEKYLIGRVLGHGGFGITYLAWDLNLDMKLAIKEYMPRDFATRTPGNTMVSVFTGELNTHFENGLTKFLDEAKTLAQFSNHPGIVGVRDFFKENGTAYLVMYYLEGIDFKQYLETQGGKIPYETALMIMMPVMDALREVHRTGTLHRDISPDNIYITSEGQVKVLDFGAARHAVSEFSKSISVILKPGFAPEEQYRSKGKQGPWTDVYATAATFYRAIVGHVPPESLDRLEEDTITPPSSLGVNIPKKVEAALMKALSVKAADRYQSMEEFQDDLFSESNISEQPITPDTSKTIAKSSSIVKQEKAQENKGNNPPGKKSTSKWFWIGGGIALAILLTIGGIATFFILDSIAAEEYEKQLEKQRIEEEAKKQQKIENIPKEVTVPNLVNQNENEAKMLLQKEGLKLGEIKYTESLFIGKGVVMSQSIQANEKAKENDTINLEVSKGVDLPIDVGTIKSKGLNLVYEYWDKGYNQSVKEDYETALRYYLQARGMALVLYEENKDIETQHTIGVLDFNVSICKSNLGYYELALPDIESSVKYLEGLPEEDEYIEDLSNSYGQLAYIQFLNKMPEQALESAEKALDLLDEEDVFILATVAHALLFAGEYEEAIDLYAELKDEVVGDGEFLGDYILEDFIYFREIGLTHPHMEVIENMYAEMDAYNYTEEEQEVILTIMANAIAFEEEDVAGYLETIDPKLKSEVEKDINAVFEAYDNIKVDFESIKVLDMTNMTAKAQVVQILSYTQNSTPYESKSTLVHYFIRSDGLYKWTITDSVVEGG